AYYFGKSPFEDPELYIRKSPFFKMDKVKAPVLIFHGSADRNVPPAQSWSYFRALQYFGKPVKYVVFPDEPHGPHKLTHQMRKAEEEIAWFDKYFFKSTKPESEALKKDSPLQAELRRKNVARVSGGYYGVVLKRPKNVDVLTVVPEMVKRGDLEVSRFEVTRIQFASCRTRAEALHSKPESPYPTAAESDRYLSEINRPAAGVSLDEAKRCAARLSELTGQEWRIPYEDEVKSLYESREGENTLDYWAAYASNPE